MINGTLIKVFFSEQLISLEVTIVWSLSFTKYELVALFAIVLFFCPLLCIIRNNAFMSNWDVLIICKKSISIGKKVPIKLFCGQECTSLSELVTWGLLIMGDATPGKVILRCIERQND